MRPVAASAPTIFCQQYVSFRKNKTVNATPQKTPRTIAALFAALTLLPVINAQTPPPAAPDTIVMEAFVTTGSNIKRLDNETTLPVTVFNMSQLETRDSATPMDLLIGIPEITNIPANESSLNAIAARGDNANVALRGLGAANTLVLLNGRRAPMEPFNTSSVNVNTLPTTGLLQLEVLRDGASAIYGSDAVAGVVNYVTEKKPHGSSVSQRFGVTQHGGGMDYKLDASYGTTFAEGKGSWMLSYSGYNRAKIMLGQRAVSANTNRMAQARAPWNTLFGGSYDGASGSGVWPFFFLGTSTTNTTGNLAFYPKSGIPTDVPSINSGTFPGSLPRGLYLNFNEWSVGQPSSWRNSLFNHVEYDVTPDVTIFGEASFYLSQSRLGRQPQNLNASDSRLALGADNPYNPYGSRFYSPTGAPNADGTSRLAGTPQQITIANVLLWDTGNEDIFTLDSEYRFLAGARGKFSNTSWNWEFGLMAGGVYAKDGYRNAIRDSYLRGAAARTDKTAWNPFLWTFKVQNGAVVADQPYLNPKSVQDTFMVAGMRYGHSKLASADFHIAGNLLDLWAGPVQASTGVDWRYEFKEDHKDPFISFNPPGSIGGDGLPLDPTNNDILLYSPKFNYGAGREIVSGYVETQIPLVAPKNNLPFARSAALNASVRTEHYSDFGYTTKPKFGGDWRPLSWLMVRGSLNKGFRAPDLADLYQPATFGVANAPGSRDPARNNFYTLAGLPPDQQVLTQSYTFSNPLLQPEISTGKSVGIVVDIPQVKGLSFTVDYWELTQNNLILSKGTTAGLDEQMLLAYTQAQLAAGKNIVNIDVGSHAIPSLPNTYAGDPNILRNPVNATDIATFQLAYAKLPQSVWLAPLGTWVGSMAKVINSTGHNFTNGFDFSVRYDLPKTPLGQFRLSTEWSEFLNKFTKSQPTFGKNDEIIQMVTPKWKSSATIQWRQGPWDASLNASYQTDFRTGATATAAQYTSLGNPSYIKPEVVISTAGVPATSYYEVGKSQLQLNAGLSYRFSPEASKWFRRTTVRLGINNLLDADPAPANLTTAGFNAGSGQSLWVGRTFTFSTTRDF
jgi:iron complex outermembrane receptor protein